MTTENNPVEIHPEHEDDPNPSGIISWRLTVRKPHTWRPPTDLYETEDRYIIRVEIAGMNKEEFCVSLDGNTLTISGSRPDMQLRRSFHQVEIPFGDFKTSVEFSTPIDSDKVTAEYRDGFLNVHLPKTQPTIIQIKE